MIKSSRISVEYDDSHDEQFICDTKSINYNTQYCHMYMQRTQAMRSLIRTNVENKWLQAQPSLQIVSRVIDCDSLNSYGDCILIGVIFKELKLRPSVIKEIQEGYHLASVPLDNMSSANDTIYLEDESGRIALAGALVTSKLAPILVTGVMIGVKGKLDNDNTKFLVNDFIYAGPHVTSIAPTLPYPLPEIDAINPNDPYILFVSGLEFGGNSNIDDNDAMMKYQLLADFINGQLGHTEIAKQICRVVVAGNLIAQQAPVSVSNNNPVLNLMRQDAIRHTKQADMLIAQILGTCPVDVLPGQNDPAAHLFPQQRIHPCFFPSSARFNTLNLVTNPHQFSIKNEADSCRILGHSGQIIQDVLMQTFNKENPDADDEINYPLNIMRRTLLWSHICPTAPDTLACYPFQQTDPFIIHDIPDIFYGGNQLYCDSEIVHYHDIATNTPKRCLLLTIPTFATSHQAVLVNTRTLETHLMSFQAIAEMSKMDEIYSSSIRLFSELSQEDIATQRKRQRCEMKKLYEDIQLQKRLQSGSQKNYSIEYDDSQEMDI